MILTYVVELNTRPTFTARRQVNNFEMARGIVESLRKLNKSAGYYKYSNPVYYIGPNCNPVKFQL